MDTPYKIKFSFYDFGIEVKCQDIKTLQNIKRDYSFFISDKATPQVSFEVFAEALDYNSLPSLKPSFYTRRNICYSQKEMSFIDYFGQAFTIINTKTNNYKIYCPEADLRHEITYLSILALVGQNLDSRKIHRVHGLGLEVNNKAVLILLPSGCGKTTLLLELLKRKNVKLISEDSPLIDSSGKILPFPLRIGICFQDKPQEIPERYLRLIKRTNLDPKYLVDIDFFKDRISSKPLYPQIILCGIRCLGIKSDILPLSKFKTLQEFIKKSVVGLGLYQGFEFLLRRGVLELFKKSDVVFSRFMNVYKVISKSKTYSFFMGTDKNKSAECLLNFLSEHG